MRPFVALLLAATVAVLLAGSGSEAGAQTGGTGEYTVTDLGVLPEGLHSEAHALNGSGQVVGGGSNADFGEVAFLYENGGMEDLGTLPGGSYSSAEGIDGSGRVVGWSDTPDNRYRAFLWRKDPATGEGTMTGLGTLLDGTGNSETPYAESQAHDINDAGQVVGWADASPDGTSQLWRHAFLWQDGRMRDLGLLAPDGSPGDSEAYAVNDSGQVVGESDREDFNGTHAFLWQNGEMIDLGTLNGGNYSVAYDINNAGQVVGVSGGTGFIWQDGAMTELAGIEPRAINDAGQVVGSTCVRDGGEEGCRGRAVVHENGQVKDLNGLIDPGLGWTLGAAADINEDGEIVGTGALNGETRAFLLTPNPDDADTAPPKLSLPGDIAQEAASADGAEVTFTATATDEEPKEPAVVCSPASGTNFPLGETAVNCSATDAAGNRAEGGFKVTVRDTTAPDTAVESGPDGPTNDDTPTFAFGGSDAVSADLHFSHKVDDGAWSGYSTENNATLGGEAGLTEGEHTFYVRAKDGAGNEDASPAEQGFTVDTTAPTAKIDSGPSGTVYAGSASFGFSGEPGATFECSLDGGPFAGCASPKQYNGLPVGEHTFEVRAKDVAGNTGAAATRTWTIGTPAAKLVGVTPGASATDVPPNANITATFSGQVNAAAFSNATFTLSPVSTAKNPKGSASTVVGSPVSAQVSYDAATNTAKLDPSKPLVLNATYQARIDGAAVGLTGGDRIWRFTTATGSGFTEQLVSVTPSYGAADVPTTTNVTATFSTDMKASSFTQNTFALIDLTNGKHIAGSVSYDPATKTATFDPQDPLLRGHIYEATLVGDEDFYSNQGAAGGTGKTKVQAVQDAEGYPLSFTWSWSFTVDVADPAGLASVSPAPSSINAAPNANVTATFSGQINAAALSSTTFTLSGLQDACGLWSVCGVQHKGGGAGFSNNKTPIPAAVSYDAATNTATLNPNGRLLKGTYEARIDGAALGLAGGERTWRFIVDGLGDVVGVTPTYNAANVPSSTNVTVTFSREMKASSFVAGKTFALMDLTNGKHIVGNISYDAATKTATFDPQSPLSPGHTYEATLVGEDDYGSHHHGGGGAAAGKTKQTVQDAEGYPLSYSTYWSFTVDIAEPGGLASVTPAPAAMGVPPNANVTATFSGRIDAAALTKSTFTLSEVTNACGLSSVCNTHTGGAGSAINKTPVAALVSYDAATKTATLNPGKVLAEGTYEARIDGAALGLAGGERTWRFMVGTGGDVVSVTPADGSTGVAASANITATFSAAMDAGSLTDGTFQLVDLMNGKHHVGKVTYDAATKTATYDPEAPLLPGHVYEVTLVPGSKAGKSPGVRDAEGNPLSAAKTWRFTVEIADP